MNSDTSADAPQDRPDEAVWGAPQPRRGWSRAQTLAALGVAAVIAVLGGAAIYAATSAGGNEMGPGMHGSGPGGPGPHGTNSRDADESAGALHGEFVVRDDAGGYKTVLTQTGVLTATSDTSITAKSADGFTQTYAIAPGNRPNRQLAVNDTVTVHGTLANGTATATSIDEGNDAGRGGPPPMGAPPGN